MAALFDDIGVARAAPPRNSANMKTITAHT